MMMVSCSLEKVCPKIKKIISIKINRIPLIVLKNLKFHLIREPPGTLLKPLKLIQKEIKLTVIIVICLI